MIRFSHFQPHVFRAPSPATVLVLAWALALVAAFSRPEPANAQPRPNNMPIAGFYGTFATDNPASALTRFDLDRPGAFDHRDVGVRISGAAGGFRLELDTVHAAPAADGQPKQVRETQTLLFQTVPTADKRTPYWRAQDTGDALAGGETVWAYVHERTLVMNSFRVLPDGRHLLRVIGFTLDDAILEMRLFLDYAGQNRRQARGELYEVIAPQTKSGN